MESRKTDNRNFGTGSLTDAKKIIEYVEKGAQGDDAVNLFKVGGHIQQIVEADRNYTKPHQLRRFYDYLVGVFNRQQALGDKASMENAIRLQLLRMVPIANYSSKRKLLGSVYNDFISKAVEVVAKRKGDEFVQALERFKETYEALVAYSGKE